MPTNWHSLVTSLSLVLTLSAIHISVLSLHSRLVSTTICHAHSSLTDSRTFISHTPWKTVIVRIQTGFRSQFIRNWKQTTSLCTAICHCHPRSSTSIPELYSNGTWETDGTIILPDIFSY